MAADIRQFNFYDQYLWQAADFTNFQSWLQQTTAGIAQGAFCKAVLSGLDVVPSGGMNVNVAAGIAVNNVGRLMMSDSQVLALTSDPSNAVWALVVLRPVNTDMDLIPEPLSPLTMVPLDTKLGYQLLVLQGTPSGSPAYPATNVGDVVLMGVKMTAAQSSLTYASFDFAQTDRPIPHVNKMKLLKATGALAVTDEIVEIDSTLGNVTGALPSLAQSRGRKVSFVRVNSAGNIAAVSGNGGDLIAGQAAITLDELNDSVTLYAGYTQWRQV